jgi:hypothetical protein
MVEKHFDNEGLIIYLRGYRAVWLSLRFYWLRHLIAPYDFMAQKKRLPLIGNL